MQPSPISSLPPEILAHIFTFYVNAPPQTPSSTDRYSQYFDNITWKEFVHIIHACRTWRAVAFGCPSLWSRIIFSHEHIVNEMRSRLKGFPLSIRLQEETLKEELLPTISSILRTDRIQELHLYLSQHSLNPLLNSSTASTFLNVQSLFVGITSARDVFSPLTPATTLPHPMPDLRHLHIVNCRLDWDSIPSCISRELVSLQLIHVYPPPPRKQFFDLLSQNPKLEVLSFVSTLPEPSSDVIHNVKLPQLSTCTIQASALAQCMDFQTHVDYPVERIKVHFRPIDAKNFHQHSASVDAALAQALVSSCIPSPHHSYRLHLVCSSEVGGPRLFVSNSKLNGPCFTLPSDDDSAISAIVDLTTITSFDGLGSRPSWPDMLSFTDLTAVGICANRYRHALAPSSANSWFHFFKRHPSILSLSISTPTLRPILSALTADLNEADVDVVKREVRTSANLVTMIYTSRIEPKHLGSLCLPHLTSIYLRECGNELLPDRYRSDCQKLLHCLDMRHELGSPIRKLEFKECKGILDVLAEKMEEVVEEFGREDTPLYTNE